MLPEEEGGGGLEGDDICVSCCKMSGGELCLLRKECGERREGAATVIAVLMFLCRLKKLGVCRTGATQQRWLCLQSSRAERALRMYAKTGRRRQRCFVCRVAADF